MKSRNLEKRQQKQVESLGNSSFMSLGKFEPWKLRIE